ncbi:MAG: ISAs1 family transposase [Mariprofundales bacterium]|nr:ISAs1 family transposase [Mariprofundales bacterium]
MMLPVRHMQALPDFFIDITDPRRGQGRRHSLPTVLSISVAATLCGAKGYKGISDWANSLGQKALVNFRCRKKNGKRVVPSLSIIRNVMVGVDPDDLDAALQRWTAIYSKKDDSLAIDGKTMRGAVAENGRQVHIMSAIGHHSQDCYAQKKVGLIPVEGTDDFKQTNEIKIASVLLDSIDNIEGVTVTADALLTQRELARYLKGRNAYYHFTVKDNQKNLRQDIAAQFQDRGAPDFTEDKCLTHGRIESRKIWVTSKLNDYLEFPDVGQAFAIERNVTNKKTGKSSCELVFGITSKTPEQASPRQVLTTNRGHWVIENGCHYIIDSIYDEDRSQIRTGHGPVNITRLRRFAVGILKSSGVKNISQKMRQISYKSRMIVDYLRMTKKYWSEVAEVN